MNDLMNNIHNDVNNVRNDVNDTVMNNITMKIPFLIIKNMRNNNLEQLPENIDSNSVNDMLNSIHAQIENQKRILLRKREYLKKTQKHNEFLEQVQKDYTKYHNFIANQKQEEMNAMTMLKSYLDDLIINGNLTNTDIEHAKIQQRKLVGEVELIKNDLDKLIA